VAAMGMPDGDHANDGALYEIKAGTVTVKGTGTLAGSARSILYGVRALVEDLGLSPAEAVACASAAPARLLGLKTKGALRPGADADVILLDGTLNVKNTFVRGELLYGNHH